MYSFVLLAVLATNPMTLPQIEAEALANIREAIQLWLEVAEEDARTEAGREAGTVAEVTV